MKKNKIIAQSTMEYILLFIIVVGALLAMLHFLKGRIQSNWRESADSFGAGRQFEKGVTNVGRW